MLSSGIDVRLDAEYFNKPNADGRSFQLLELFDLSLSYATNEDKKKLNLGNIFVKQLVKYKFIRNKYFYFHGYDSVKYDNEIANLKEGYLDGYWQNLQYFSDCELELRKTLNIKKTISDANSQFQNILNNHYTIAIHIRRGDYVSNNFYFDLFNSNYYENAVSYFKNKFENMKFLFFSDDIDWVKKNIKYDKLNSIFIERDSVNSNLSDFDLMVKCNSIVIANSTFSWWAAWLNNSPEKIVIAPDIWLAHFLPNNLIHNKWIIMPH